MNERHDDRTAEQKKTHTWLVAGTDRFMTGFGQDCGRLGRGQVSIAAWACKTEDLALCELWVRERSDMRRVRIVVDPYYPKGRYHLHIYVFSNQDL